MIITSGNLEVPGKGAGEDSIFRGKVDVHQVKFSKESVINESESTTSIDDEITEQTEINNDLTRDNENSFANEVLNEGTEIVEKTPTTDQSTWVTESWIATGELAVDTSGLGIEGSINAAYYKAGTQIPNRILEIPA